MPNNDDDDDDYTAKEHIVINQSNSSDRIECLLGFTTVYIDEAHYIRRTMYVLNELWTSRINRRVYYTIRSSLLWTVIYSMYVGYYRLSIFSTSYS